MRVVVVDFSPTHGVELTATAGNALGFHDPVGMTWIAHGGVIAAPSNTEPVALAWRNGLGVPAPKSVATKKWKIKGVQRAQRAGDAVLAEVITKAYVRQQWWFDAADTHLIADQVSEGIRAEVIGPRLALRSDPYERQFELLIAPDRRIPIELPPLIANDLAGGPTSRDRRRVLVAVRDAGMLVVAGTHRVYIFELDDLAALVDQTEVDWYFDWVFPRGDANARVHGVVTMSQWGRTNILVGDRKLVFRETPLVKDEPVELRELLWDALASVVYRDIVRADGTVIPCPGAPLFDDTATTRIGP
jgi:hypothetical protein